MKINLIEFFEETVNSYPDKIAVVDGDRQITFRELSDKANVMAMEINRTGIGINRPVAVLLPKCTEAIIANIAIMKSGNCFMNLDVKTPSQRIGNIIELIEPGLIISDIKNISTFEGIINDLPSIMIDSVDFNQNIDSNLISQLKKQNIDTDPFCIINTSGSTGTPKGVALNHLGFIDFIYRSQEAFNLGSDLIMGSLSPIVFDIYVLELCLLMVNSATLVVLPAHLSAFPAAILKQLRKHDVNFIFWVPTIMVNIANMGLLSKVELPSLRLIWFAGEVFPTKQFNIWRRALPHTSFANLYGPIETSVDSIFYKIEKEIPDNEPIPIGHAYRNTDIMLLDEKDHLVTAPNVEGEICVRGSSLALGYYNNPTKTAAAFVQNPLNDHYPERIYRTGDMAIINDKNEIVFRGRKDSLIKHQGYRIELGEIEHVIVNTLGLVKNGCVVYNRDKKQITLFYERQEDVDRILFNKSIETVLPRYMLPAVLIREDELKRNTNGKIDRAYYNKLIND